MFEFNGETLTVDTADGKVTVTVNRDGTADVLRNDVLCGTLYPVGHSSNWKG